MRKTLIGLLLISTSALADNGGLDPKYPTTVSNIQVWQMYQTYQIMMEEIDLSVSKKNAGLLTHDAARWQSYIAQLRADTAYWASQEFLDMPVTHGVDWDVTDPLDPACPFKDNTSICVLTALVKTARDEIILSASAGVPMHLYPQDSARQEQYWRAMEGYISHILSTSPLDEPVTAAEENLGLVPGFSQPDEQ